MNRTRYSGERAVALVIVLAAIALMSALLVAFMGKVGTERTASRIVAQSFEAKQAYDSAVNLVMAQIREATRNPDGHRAWASQPGVIHVFDDNGKDVGTYKLYSSDKMYDANYAPTNPQESGIDTSDLTRTPDGFVDLNEPLLTPVPGDTTGKMEPHYPIANPYARQTIFGTETTPGHGLVTGFVAANVNLSTGAKDKNGKTILALPMRVKWLYQLKDGTFAAVDASGKIPGATKQNPPVARVAFWTDDETAKINVNTAGENTFWDTPAVSCYQESGNVNGSGNLIYDPNGSLALASSQPSNGEYQRYPGHPATTSLSTVLRGLAPVSMTDVDFKEAIFRLSPRYVGGYGTSMGASRNTEYDTDYRVPKRDRLFATLDEYWFRPDRTPIANNGLYRVFRTTSAAGVVDTKFVDSTNLNLTPETLDRMRFFLTATSRAPDLNLWGMPRVCIWPVSEVDSPDPAISKRTGYDDLIAFCSTVAGKTYYFTRSQPWSTTYDYEQSGISGAKGRNQVLVEKYLRRLCGQPVPGVGRSFAQKYNGGSPPYTDLDQILLSIFDYIRATNLVDTGYRTAGIPPGGGYPLAYTPGYTNNHDYSGGTKPNQGSGQVIPTVRYSGGEPVMKGYGRFVTPAEVGLLFYVDTNALPGDELAPPGVVGTDYLPIRCVLITEMYSINAGYPALSEAYAYTVKEGTPFQVGSVDGVTKQAMALADGSVNYVEVDAWRVPYGRFFMPTRGFTNQFYYDGIAPNTGGGRFIKQFAKPNMFDGTPNNYRKFPFYSKRFYLPLKTPSGGVIPQQAFKLYGGTLTYTFYPLNVPNAAAPPATPPAVMGQPIQKVTVQFPDVTLPNPQIGGTPFENRLSSVSGDGLSLLQSQDVTRSLEACGIAHGDIRLVAGATNVPATYFAPSGANGDYANFSKRQVHNFRSGWGRPYANSIWGVLSNGATTRSDKIAKVPKNNGNAVAASDPSVTGDFDRGLSKHMDGPFINKGDEGNTRFKLDDDPAGGGDLPYYRGANGYEEAGQTYFSPNRLVSSPAMFGSLPTAIMSSQAGSVRPWETLLFAPPVATNHKGAQSPADHYLLDLFQMPVVEPYAISEPLSTMGKINLNCRLAPFGYVKVAGRGYIERTSGIHALLKGLKQLVVPNGSPDAAHTERPLTSGGRYRYDVDPFAEVERVINPRLDTDGYFRSPTQFCELDMLLTSGLTTPSPAIRKLFWEANTMTGDNQRERLYSFVYPRLTTKSNVYTVHVWAQSITKNPNTKADDWNKFDENVDHVSGEYRGSTTVERFIDPNDTALTGYDATDSNATDLERYYRFRILNTKRFIAQ